MAVYFDGYTYFLTKHGRTQFRNRVGHLEGDELLKAAIFNRYGCKAEWAPDSKQPVTGRRLVTIKLDEKQMIRIL